MRLVAARDAAAFEELYRRHASAVAAVASRVCADRDDADEATQFAFLALWNRAASIDVRGASLRPWLVTVGRNAALDRVRRRRPTVPADETHASIPAREATPEEAFMQSDARRDVRAAIERLDPEQRTVVELAFFGGLTQTEIAAATGAPLGTVKSRIRLAMRHLRRALAPLAEEMT